MGKTKLLYKEDEVQHMVMTMAVSIRNSFQISGRPMPVLLVVLKGAAMFAMDLFKCLPSETEIEFIKVSSYEGTEQGEFKFEYKPDKEAFKGKDVLIVEDIVDTGATVKNIQEWLTKETEADNVYVATLLDKTEARVHKDVHIHFSGFGVNKDDFVLGYGLDLNGKFRNLPFICTV